MDNVVIFPSGAPYVRPAPVAPDSPKDETLGLWNVDRVTKAELEATVAKIHYLPEHAQIMLRAVLEIAEAVGALEEQFAQVQPCPTFPN